MKISDVELLANHSEKIVSLGSFCITSSIFKHFNIKKSSMPFDWLFCQADTTAKCIEDDFAVFLDRSKHISRTAAVGTPRSGHIIYDRDVTNEAMFNHFDITEDSVFDYYQRCVDRFRRSAHSDDPTIYICISDRYFGNQTEFYNLSKALKNHTKNSWFIGISLVINNLGSANVHLEKTFDDNDGHRFFRFSALSKNIGTEFQSDIDNMMVLNLALEAVKSSGLG